MKKIKNQKIKKDKKIIIEIESGELSLIIEALKNMEKRVHEDMFYRHDHPQGFYEIYFERYNRLIGKLDGKYPMPVFIKIT
jgi:hypothetical protein